MHCIPYVFWQFYVLASWLNKNLRSFSTKVISFYEDHILAYSASTIVADYLKVPCEFLTTSSAVE